MKRDLVSLAACLSLLYSCSKDDNEFSNKLILGTGVNPNNLFEITGVGTTFSVPATIYFRLESEVDMAGSDVLIRIDIKEGPEYVEFTSFTFDNPQATGHILSSSFTLETGGLFKATGVLITGGRVIASKEFTVN
jgi:hypothetical protein